jgi:hypothetical protein
MRNLLATFILSCVLTGCIITKYDGLHDIINENIEVYQKHEKIEFTNVAAIFKTYAILVNGKEYQNLEELKKDTENFVETLKKKNISNNYPVKASEDELYVAHHFLKDVFYCLRENDVGASHFQEYINQALKVYITEIIHHEEKVPQ